MSGIPLVELPIYTTSEEEAVALRKSPAEETEAEITGRFSSNEELSELSDVDLVVRAAMKIFYFSKAVSIELYPHAKIPH